MTTIRTKIADFFAWLASKIRPSNGGGKPTVDPNAAGGPGGDFPP